MAHARIRTTFRPFTLYCISDCPGFEIPSSDAMHGVSTGIHKGGGGKLSLDADNFALFNVPTVLWVLNRCVYGHRDLYNVASLCFMEKFHSMQLMESLLRISQSLRIVLEVGNGFGSDAEMRRLLHPHTRRPKRHGPVEGRGSSTAAFGIPSSGYSKLNSRA